VSLIIPIARGNDDAEELTQRGQNGIEVYESGYTYHDSTDLELTYDGWFSAHQMVGLRFVGVAIPRHAHITDAFIHFTVRDGDSASVNLTVSGEASGNALGFSMTRYNLSSRSRTGATVSWRGLAAWSDGERRNSPQLSTIIQEIINQASWASGNALVILIEGTGDDRAAYSYDGRQAAAPRLHVTYE
jgi:hypothetical protein